MKTINPAEGIPATPAQIEMQVEISKVTNSLRQRGFDVLTIAHELRHAALVLTVGHIALNTPAEKAQ